jgi:two-component system, response regulator PdtaR
MPGLAAVAQPSGGFGQRIALRNPSGGNAVTAVMVLSRPHPPAAEGNARHAIVMVVEDEILIRAAVAEHLRISGYTVVEAADAAEAIAVFASGEPIDVVMCDVDMPGTMNGLSLARWINRHHSTLPVLLTSGRGVALAAGDRLARSFISKPFRLRELTERIRLMLGSGDSTAEG